MSILSEMMLISEAASSPPKKFSCSTPIAGAADETVRDEDELGEVPSSLAEFEENEKRAAAAESWLTSDSTTASTISSPANKLEALLAELRICFENDSKIASWSPLKDDSPSDSSSNEDLVSRLEREIVRRAQCERQIEELSAALCDMRQQLGLAAESEKKRQLFAKNMDSSLIKISNEWRAIEAGLESKLKKADFEKQEFLKREAKLLMRNQLLEEEMRKLADDLVNEKVNSQNLSGQVLSLRKSLGQVEEEKEEQSERLEQAERQIKSLEDEIRAQNDQISELKSTSQKLVTENKDKESQLTTQMEQLKTTSQQTNKKYENLRGEYERLAQEAKLVVEESEKQLRELSKCLEAERISKDSLQVELNVLEEKYENTIKTLQNEFDNKLNKIKLATLEKEKSAVEEHTNEMEKLSQKSKLEIERLKTKYFDDLKTNVNDYESKMTDLRLKIDSYRTEIDRLKKANKDIEEDRNRIRQNLKTMLDVQMKEAYQLLGLQPPPQVANSSSTMIPPRPTETNELKSTAFGLDFDNFLASINKPITSSLSEIGRVSSREPCQASPSPSPAAKPQNNVEQLNTTSIKDEFILSQIELINKYYQIDSKSLSEDVPSDEPPPPISAPQSARGASSRDESKLMMTPRESSLGEADRNISSASRANELKHYIEMLLNRSPSEAKSQTNTGTQEDDPAEGGDSSGDSIGTNSIEEPQQKPKMVQKQAHRGLFYGENDLSDSDSVTACTGSGYTKRQSLDYYDDVKKNLNFDDEDDEDTGKNIGLKKNVNFVDQRDQNREKFSAAPSEQLKIKTSSSFKAATTTPSELNLSTSSRTNSMISLSTVTSGGSSVIRPSSVRLPGPKQLGRRKWK